MYNRDSKIMRKLLGKSAPESNAGNLASVTSNPAPTSISFRPSKSQSAVYSAGVPISRLDVSPDRRAAVLGGAHILKTVILDDPTGSSFSFNDGVDVRAAITAQQAHATASTNRPSAIADQLNIRDVKWHNNSTIFTGCASGRIFAYDLARIGAGGSEPLECIQMQEDSRQVNTLDVNPHLQSWVLSGSQDGVARIFDASKPSQNRAGFVTFRQRFAPLKCIDSVRQVKWSPRVGHEMACCTENGVVLKWDVRQQARPLLRINAHEKACSAIAWHPDGHHLISAGWDTKLHVWDLGPTADKRQKPKWTVATPAPVTTVAWRPGLWSATTQSRRAAQVAVTYDENNAKRYGTSVVHIWDLARPTMPYKEVDSFDSSPTALWWKDQDMLWTVGDDETFTQCDIAFAPNVIDRMSMSAMAFSPRGDALLFLDERVSSPRPRLSAVHHQHEIISRSTYSSATSTPMLSVSKSDSEEEAVGNFLGPRWKTHRRRRPSMRSGSGASTTPPSGSGMPEDAKMSMSLEQAIKVTGIFKSHQGMASGHLPAAKTVHSYQYLSSIYLEILEQELPYTEGGKPLVERLRLILEQFAKAAEAASLFRLSQTWRVLAYSMTLLLNQRAQYHLETRLSRFQKLKTEESKNRDRLTPSMSYGSFRGDGSSTPRFIPGQAGSFDVRSHSLRSLLSEEIESTSNVPTPIARPVDSVHNTDFAHHQYTYGKKLTPIIEPESLNLGPAAHGSFRESPRKRLDSTPISVVSQESEQTQISSTEGYDFYDTDVLAKAIDVPPHGEDSHVQWAAKAPSPPSTRRKVPRHDSDESFGQMFSISAGNKQSPGSDYYLKSRVTRQPSDSDKSVEDINNEYASRIRGEELSKSSPFKTLVRRETRGASPMTQSPEEIFMISQSTAYTDETYNSQSSQSMQSISEEQDMNDQTIGSHMMSSHPTIRGDQSPQVATYLREVAHRHDPSPHILETDYLPWPEDPEYPFPVAQGATSLKAKPMPKPPLDPYVLVKRALEFETRTSALNASAIILLLKPLVPRSVIDQHQARGILRQHHSRLMRMGLFVEAATLRNLCIKGWPANLPDWGDSYTVIFEPAQQNVKVGFACSSCHKPREIDRTEGPLAIWTCERCKSLMAPCAVCGHREMETAEHEPTELLNTGSSEATTLLGWWYCPGCAHGGHASCLQTWHGTLDLTGSVAVDLSSAKYSEGCCPLDGCGHACLPGKYRGEITTARADELGRVAVETSRAREERLAAAQAAAAASGSASASALNSDSGGGGGGSANGSVASSNARPGPWTGHQPERSSVKSDANDVAQSRAVGMAREALNKGGVAGGGILSSSPGRASGERERRKSVKFAQTGSGSR
ncbi:WD repeat-containing protein [Paramyrothecium foliicola]|nr:WD repeat-containing protein [Paramyrothecium foliicola]